MARRKPVEAALLFLLGIERLIRLGIHSVLRSAAPRRIREFEICA
jgi:hypothetical protein